MGFFSIDNINLIIEHLLQMQLHSLTKKYACTEDVGRFTTLPQGHGRKNEWANGLDLCDLIKAGLRCSGNRTRRAGAATAKRWAIWPSVEPSLSQQLAGLGGGGEVGGIGVDYCEITHTVTNSFLRVIYRDPSWRPSWRVSHGCGH